MFKLLYKGKSNRKFTHNYLYNYFVSSSGNTNKNFKMIVVVYDNRNSMISIKDNDYFEDILIMQKNK